MAQGTAFVPLGEAADLLLLSRGDSAYHSDWESLRRMQALRFAASHARGRARPVRGRTEEQMRRE